MLIYLQTIETEEDKSKFEDIYREYRGLMYYVAYKRLHHEQDAEDAVHYAFMKIAENIKIIDPVSPKTKQLVVTIVDNRVTDMLRMNGRHPTAEYNDEILNQLSAELHTDDLLTEATGMHFFEDIITYNGTPGYRYFVDAFCYAGDKTGYDEKAYSSVVKTAVR